MKLYLDKRCQYGQIRYFPVGPGSENVIALTGKKTLTEKDIRNLEMLEHEVFVASVEGELIPAPFVVSWRAKE